MNSPTRYLKPVAMAMQFTRVVSPVEDMEIWNASSDGLCVIDYESCSGPGFHGRTGFVASWRYARTRAAEIETNF